MRDIDDFLPLINVWAPAAPEPVTLNFLRQAAKELCQRTRCWQGPADIEHAIEDELAYGALHPQMQRHCALRRVADRGLHRFKLGMFEQMVCFIG